MNIFEYATRWCRDNDVEAKLPENWFIYEVSMDPDEAPEGFIKVRGAQFQLYKKGDLKGTPNYNKVTPGSSKIFFVPRQTAGQ